MNIFHQDIKEAINKKRGILETHRGVAGTWDTISTVIASLVIFYPITYLVQKYKGINYSFFKTDSADLVNSIENTFIRQSSFT